MAELADLNTQEVPSERICRDWWPSAGHLMTFCNATVK